MKVGIRSKLVLAFILIILVPLVITVGSISYVFSKFENSGEAKQLQNIQDASLQVLDLVTGAFPVIKDYDQFFGAVEPVLKSHQFQLQVVNVTSGKLLFDSRDKEGSAKGREIDLNPFWDTSRLYLETFLYTVPVKPDGNTIKAVITLDPSVGSIYLVERMLGKLFLSLGAGFTVLVILIGLFTWYFSRSILKPLKELNAATEAIALGSLDYEIKYQRDDELGRFCQTFNLMRAKLKQSLQEQAAAEKSRRELIAGISHDLRTPIASIKGYVEGLQDGVVKDKEMFDRYLSVIKGKSEQLDRQIDDLFQFSRLELGKLEVLLRRENSLELLEDIKSKLELEFDTHLFVFEKEKPIPSVPILVDRLRITQVVDNLMQNAKQNVQENGQIRMKACLEEGSLVIVVADNGSGIDESELTRIFEPFYRGEKSRSRDYGGTGLGLAICKYIVEAHQGKIWAASTPGKGSTFCFSLPVI